MFLNQSQYFIYILLCENGSFYTGFTTNLARRYEEHMQGTAKCKYTRSFKPLCILQSWEVLASKEIAMRVERFIKTLKKPEKLKLIAHPQKLADIFPVCVIKSEEA